MMLFGGSLFTIFILVVSAIQKDVRTAAIAGLISYGLLLVFAVRVQAWAQQMNAAARALNLLEYVGKRPDDWRHPERVRETNRLIESLAAAIESELVDQLGSPPGTRVSGDLADLRMRASYKANYVRWLKTWVIQPGPFTFTDLMAELTRTLILISVDESWDLPERERGNAGPAPASGRIRWLALTLLIIATAVLIALVFLRIPSATSAAIATTAGTVLAIAFGRLGLDFGSVEKGGKLGREFTSRGDKGDN